MLTAIAFNLLISSSFSFLAGLIVVWFFLKFFRVEVGAWKILLLMAPFVKVVYDFVVGIPDSSILFSGLNPFELEPGQRMLSLGIGFSSLGYPYLTFVLFVKKNGAEYFASLADFLYFFLTSKINISLIQIFLGVLCFVSIVKTLNRIVGVIRFEYLCSKLCKQSKLVLLHKIKFRTVVVFISDHFHGSPFTGGVFRPYICFPADSYSQLSNSEFDAVLKHELCHVQRFDVVFNFIVQFLGDLFWFIPGYSRLSKNIDKLREVVADHAAVQSGASALHLANAMIKIHEVSAAIKNNNLYSAFFREKSIIQERILRITGDLVDPKSRFGWQYLLVRIVVLFIVYQSVIQTTFLGNQNTNRVVVQHPFIEFMKEKFSNRN